MNKLYYVCKYTPIELLEALGADCANLNEMPEGFECADQIAHPNICGFGKAVIEQVMSGQVKELVLVNCCDTIRSVYDILAESGKLDFLYMLDMLRSTGECSRERTVAQLHGLAKAYSEYRGTTFDREAFFKAFRPNPKCKGPYISILGARMGAELGRAREALEEQRDYYLQKIAEDSTILENLKDDRYLEQYAREHYLMKRKDETIYLLR